ncbi:MAG: Putative transmembrane protein [uncultured Paraburkholderia sp.]|nr:MAG: Putative transmembrane protein [uncultured Paraburkholderia sp.]CAH2790678.1 MAG: Putative transmembrane protein [uncultured Paraburkholderia sp.]CAH2924677.1 MAG: Putative transmembrane protein [uncultured Paraburkholderia sp.]CAH2927421.1 MAG: Putative transmembrane protein [uncultured Paraburkholderia sp.]
MNDLLRSFGRALASALHPRMLWLTFMPFVAATVGWGVILWFSWQTLLRRFRLPLLLIGVASGLLGSLPTLLWASSVWLVVLFPVITAVTIWIYAFILVFSALWFGYYCLRALQRMRADEAGGVRHAAPVPY